MKIEFKLNQLENTVKMHILPLLAKRSIITFTGPLGAGKTTMIKEILRQCGVSQNVTSPTFGYVNSYQPSSGKVFNHFDLYRIESIDEFVVAGFDEYFYRSDNVNFIEWPQVISDLLDLPAMKDKVAHIKIGYKEGTFDSRLLEIIRE